MNEKRTVEIYNLLGTGSLAGRAVGTGFLVRIVVGRHTTFAKFERDEEGAREFARTGKLTTAALKALARGGTTKGRT
jgi:hypothetical protein